MPDYVSNLYFTSNKRICVTSNTIHTCMNESTNKHILIESLQTHQRITDEVNTHKYFVMCYQTVLPYEFTPRQLSYNLLASSPELCPGLSQISRKAQPVNVSLVNTNRNHWLLVRSATQQFCLIYSRHGDMCVFLRHTHMLVGWT